MEFIDSFTRTKSDTRVTIELHLSKRGKYNVFEETVFTWNGESEPFRVSIHGRAAYRKPPIDEILKRFKSVFGLQNPQLAYYIKKRENSGKKTPITRLAQGQSIFHQQLPFFMPYPLK